MSVEPLKTFIEAVSALTPQLPPLVAASVFQGVEWQDLNRDCRGKGLDDEVEIYDVSTTVRAHLGEILVNSICGNLRENKEIPPEDIREAVEFIVLFVCAELGVDVQDANGPNPKVVMASSDL